MKLIDLLVQELPKRGGWKENWVSVTQDADGYFCCWRYDDPKCNEFRWMHRTGKGLVGYWRVDNDNDVVLSCDSAESIVTKNQYESALALSQKPAWNGEGVPPVGCECEYQYKVHGSEWCRFECVAVDGKAVFGWSNNTPIALQSNTHNFRPLRTEADKKRDAALDAIYGAIASAKREHNRSDEADEVYKTIAAGKIPGVKLEG